MSSLWTDLLFLHGHIADAHLARRVAMPERAAPTLPLRVPQRVSVGKVSDVRGGAVRGRLFVFGRLTKTAWERGFRGLWALARRLPYQP